MKKIIGSIFIVFVFSVFISGTNEKVINLTPNQLNTEYKDIVRCNKRIDSLDLAIVVELNKLDNKLSKLDLINKKKKKYLVEFDNIVEELREYKISKKDSIK